MCSLFCGPVPRRKMSHWKRFNAYVPGTRSLSNSFANFMVTSERGSVINVRLTLNQQHLDGLAMSLCSNISSSRVGLQVILEGLSTL